MRLAVLAFVLTVSACAEFPVLDQGLTAADRAAPYPDLLPLDALDAPEPADDPEAAVLEARIAALQTRAAALRRTLP